MSDPDFSKAELTALPHLIDLFAIVADALDGNDDADEVLTQLRAWYGPLVTTEGSPIHVLYGEMIDNNPLRAMIE